MYVSIHTDTHTHVWSFKPSYNNSVGKRKTCTHTKEFTTYSLRKEKITAINMYIYIYNKLQIRIILKLVKDSQ